MSSLQRRVEDLEAKAAAADGDGEGGFAPLCVEIRDGETEEEAIERARAKRDEEGRPIRPITGGPHGPIRYIIVDLRTNKPMEEEQHAQQ